MSSKLWKVSATVLDDVAHAHTPGCHTQHLSTSTANTRHEPVLALFDASAQPPIRQVRHCGRSARSYEGCQHAVVKVSQTSLNKFGLLAGHQLRDNSRGLGSVSVLARGLRRQASSIMSGGRRQSASKDGAERSSPQAHAGKVSYRVACVKDFILSAPGAHVLLTVHMDLLKSLAVARLSLTADTCSLPQVLSLDNCL